MKRLLIFLFSFFIISVVFLPSFASVKKQPNKEEQLIVEGKETQNSNLKVLGVNSFLWYATRDVLNFLPLQTLNPLTGVLISDWYTSKSNKNERIKIQVTVKSKTLRTDAVKVQVFQQQLIKGQWVNVSINPATNVYIQDAILRQARKLRIASGKSSLK